MTPRIDLPRPTHDVTPAFDGLVAPAAEHMGGAPGEGWATIAAAVPTRSQILRDLANLCTFTGAILATLAMACMWKGKYVHVSSPFFLAEKGQKSFGRVGASDYCS